MPSQWPPALPVLLFLPTRTLDPLPTRRKQAGSFQPMRSTLGDINHTLLILVGILITDTVILHLFHHATVIH